MSESSKENLSSSSVLSFTPPVTGSKSAQSHLGGIRPLTQSYKAAASDYEVLSMPRHIMLQIIYFLCIQTKG